MTFTLTRISGGKAKAEVSGSITTLVANLEDDVHTDGTRGRVWSVSLIDSFGRPILNDVVLSPRIAVNCNDRNRPFRASKVINRDIFDTTQSFKLYIEEGLRPTRSC